MPSTPSTRWGFQRPADADQINTWPASMRATIDAIDAIAAGIIFNDPRPAAGVAGRFHRHPVTGVVSFDTGSGWVEMARLPHASAHLEGGADPVAGQVPIGGIIAYAGGALPSGTEWAWADGSLIDRTTFATFFGRVGHAYNGGVDPGSNKVRLPDKRGRVPMGADNFGVGSGGLIPTEVAAGRGTRGSKGGEERHTLTTPELAAHAHGAASGTESADHTHGGSTDSQGNHYHTAGIGGLWADSDNGVGGQFLTSGTAVSTIWHANTNTTGAHGHNFGTGGRSAAHTHAITVDNAGGGGSHQNLQPYEADTYLVRIA